MESGERLGLSTAAVVAIACNAMVAILLLVLFLIIYRACKVPSSQERVPVLAVPAGQPQQSSEHKYLLTS
uniref:Adropin n=1 Tax=Salmo trutta TaxID=8032 RepID=A0A673WBU2_SALTR